MNTSRSRHAAALLTLAAAASSASATDLYWNQPAYTGNVATAANWNTLANGTGSTGVPDTTTPVDDLFFNATEHNAIGGDINVTANFAARSLTFNTSGATRLVQSGVGSQNLNLGSGGINLGSLSNAVTFGTGNFFYTRITATQTWTNDSASLLTVRNINSNTASGPVTLTLNAASSGGITLSQNITDTVDNPLSIEINSENSSTLVSMSAAGSTYRGNTTINRGSLFFTTNNGAGSLGTGEVFLGNTSAGNDDATLTTRSTSISNNITVRSGNSGIKTLVANQGLGAVLTGTLTLNDSLALTTTTTTSFTNAISGAGDIVKTGNGALTFSGANTSSGDLTLTTGAFTLAATTGSLTFYIGDNGVTNQVNGATTGAVAFNGTFNLNLDDAELITGNSWTLVSLASTVESYGALFSLTGFNDNDADNIWTSASGFSFSETTGVLTYTAIPEPSSFALLAAFGALTATACRRKRKA